MSASRETWVACQITLDKWFSPLEKDELFPLFAFVLTRCAQGNDCATESGERRARAAQNRNVFTAFVHYQPTVGRGRRSVTAAIYWSLPQPSTAQRKSREGFIASVGKTSNAERANFGEPISTPDA